jgi:hypothetical protein
LADSANLPDSDGETREEVPNGYDEPKAVEPA